MLKCYQSVQSIQDVVVKVVKERSEGIHYPCLCVRLTGSGIVHVACSGPRRMHFNSSDVYS